MPNYVCTDVKITGDCKGFVEKYSTVLEEGGEFFQMIIPMEKSLLESDKWYDWRCNHWGTKWDVCNVGYCYNPIEFDEVELWIQTAWSHPFPIFQKLADEFPSLHFDIAYCSEDILSGNNGWYEIFRNDELDDSDNPAKMEENAQFREEILSRTWGVDWLDDVCDEIS